MPRVLIVDDEKSIRELARMYLLKEGFAVDEAGSGREALAKLVSLKPSLVVLDIMLPDISGFDVCREIRKVGDVPVLMLTARREDIDKILGLELGADDYLTKPFNPRELLARINAILRRCAAGHNHGRRIEAGNLAVDRARREASIGGEQVRLRAREFDMLAALADNFGIVLSRERMLEMIWETDYYGETRTIDMHITHLREKIAPADVEIETVRGVGYKLVPRGRACGAKE